MNTTLYDPIRRELRPAYDRLADARYIKRDPRTDEISWPPTDIIAQLREAGLVS